MMRMRITVDVDQDQNKDQTEVYNLRRSVRIKTRFTMRWRRIKK